MIDGHVTESLDPVIEIGIFDGKAVETISVVVDTGFNGGLCLSMRHFASVELSYLYAEPFELANGQKSEEDVYRSRVLFDGVAREIEVVLTDAADSLIGAELLKDRTLFIDYPARKLRIE